MKYKSIIGLAVAFIPMLMPGIIQAQTPAPQAFPEVGFIGDSIMEGYNQVGHTITPGTNDVASLTVKKLSQTNDMALIDNGVPWRMYDRGSSGSSTSDWLPSKRNGLDERAKAAFISVFGKPNPKTNPVWILVMLGTNDVRSDNRFTAEKHRRNLQTITGDLVANGYNVVINYPPSFVIPTRFNGVAWDADSDRLLRAYLPEEQAVVASFDRKSPGRVFLGDTVAYSYFATRPTLFQEYGVYGGLHPNGIVGTDALADCWVLAFLHIKHG
jgi:lysophospholipase L1-like esterase